MKNADEKNNTVVLQVKKNHSNLHNEISKFSTLNDALDEAFNFEINRGREETRNIKIFNFSSSNWPEVKLGIKLFRHTIRKKANKITESRNVSYFICNHKLPAQKLNTIIRNHWCIENKDHHVRDNVLLEDSNRIKIKAEIMMTIRSFGFNIIQINKKDNSFSNQTENNKLEFDKLLLAKGVLMK